MKTPVKPILGHPRWQLKLSVTVLALVSAGGAAATSLGLVDAIRLTLSQNPDIQIQGQQLQASQGLLQQASGQFDTTLNLTGTHTTDNGETQQQSSTGYSLSVRQTLRNGLVLNPGISTTRNAASTLDLNQQPAQNSAKVSINLLLPLNQDRRASAALGETAALLARDASQQDVRLTMARAVLNTVSAYWQWVAARHTLIISRDAETSMAQQLRETQKLIEADEMTAADLLLVRASLMDRTSARLGAEQTLLEAGQKLGQIMGLAPAQLDSLDPQDDFPPLQQGLLATDNVQQRLLALALQQRADLAAARLRQEAAKVARTVAQSGLQAPLDLNLNVGYTTRLDSNAANSLVSVLGQPRSSSNIGTSISWQWPVENNVARGRYLQQSAAYDQTTVQLNTLEQTISLGVTAAWQAVIRSARQAQEAEAAVALYQLTAKNEKTKSQLGNATLIDVLSVQDRLRSAQQNQISYHLNYLNALAQLRFETGSLLADEATAASIRLGTFISPPTLD